MVLNGRKCEDAVTELVLIFDYNSSSELQKPIQLYFSSEAEGVSHSAIQYLVFLSNRSYNRDCSSHPTSHIAPTHLRGHQCGYYNHEIFIYGSVRVVTAAPGLPVAGKTGPWSPFPRLVEHRNLAL